MKNSPPSLDFFPIGIYVQTPRPNRGRARGRSNAGTAEAAASEMRRRGLRDRTGDIRAGWCGGRNGRHATPARRPKPRGPGAPAARHRDMAADAPAPSLRGRLGQLPQAVGRRWKRRTAKADESNRSLKGSPTGGHAEQASNTARGTPGNRRTCGSISTRQASVSRGAEARGSFGTPAFRAPSDFLRSTD